MLTDATALLVAVIASRIAERPAKGAYTFGFARVDALSGQANGITLVLLAVWFTVEAIRRLIDPPDAGGGVIVIVAGIGIAVNVLATTLAARADKRSLNVRGAVAHLVNDLWAFVATFVAGIVIMVTDWTRADAVASLVVAALMTVTGAKLIRDAGGCSSRRRRPAWTRCSSAPSWRRFAAWPRSTICTSGNSRPERLRCRPTCWSTGWTTAMSS